MNEFDSDLVIEIKSTATSKGKTTLATTAGDQVIHIDEINLKSDRARRGYVTKLTTACGGLEERTDELTRLLLGLAHDEAQREESQQAPSDSDEPELTLTSIVRPELFHTSSVSALLMPRIRISRGKPTAEWAFYLRWHADGKRERLELTDSIKLPDGGTLWIYPQPGEASPTQRQGWTVRSRQEWLEGADPPDPVDVFQRVCKIVAHFLEFPAETASGVTATLANWILLSYVYPAWQAVPYLSIGGPLGSGKSTLFRVLGQLCFRPLESSNMTAPCLFRSIHELGGTVLLDEAERLRDSAPEAGELRSILLSGYKKGSPAMRLDRAGDGSFRLVHFDVYGPKAFAAIARLPEALASRCIPIAMLRADPESSKPKRRINSQAEVFSKLRDDLHALALEHGRTWLELENRADVCPDALAGREWELWQPILAIGSWLQQQGAAELSDILSEFAVETVELSRDDCVSNADEILLRIVAEHVRGGTQSMLRPGQVLEKACERDPAVFGKSDNPRWSAKGVGNHLRAYGLFTTKGTGTTGRVYSTVTLDDLRRLERTYGFDLS